MFMALLICPFNIVYRSSRYYFLRVIRNIMLSPLYKVVMVDFFMADQLCSQVPTHLVSLFLYELPKVLQRHNKQTISFPVISQKKLDAYEVVLLVRNRSQCSEIWNLWLVTTSLVVIERKITGIAWDPSISETYLMLSHFFPTTGELCRSLSLAVFHIYHSEISCVSTFNTWKVTDILCYDHAVC